METAAELRAEAARLRAYLRNVTDPAERSAIAAMIDELEERASISDNGDASDDD